MGRTWPNLNADRVEQAGYYWNEKLHKLARLQVGEKLPRKPGHWEFVARDDEGSSSEIASRIYGRYPDMDVNDFSYTVTSPVGRRIPLGDRHWSPAVIAVGACGLVVLGAVIGRLVAKLD